MDLENCILEETDVRRYESKQWYKNWIKLKKLSTKVNNR